MKGGHQLNEKNHTVAAITSSSISTIAPQGSDLPVDDQDNGGEGESSNRQKGHLASGSISLSDIANYGDPVRDKRTRIGRGRLVTEVEYERMAHFVKDLGREPNWKDWYTFCEMASGFCFSSWLTLMRISLHVINLQDVANKARTPRAWNVQCSTKKAKIEAVLARLREQGI